jgi:hypothetical protein
MAQRRPRRVFLQSTAAGIAGLAGCTLLESQTGSQIPRLIGLAVLNYDDAPHTVHLQLELEGETVYRRSEQIAGSEPNDSEGALFSEYPTASEPYVLSAWCADRPKATVSILDFSSFDAECLGVTVYIGSYGVDTENPRLAIYFSTNCRL